LQLIRLCHCIEDLNAWGAQQVVRHLVCNLDQSRFRCLVYTFKRGPIADIIEDSGCVVRLLKRKFPKLDLSLVRRLRRSFEQDQIEILHTHLFGASLHALIAAGPIPSLSKITTLHADREDNLIQRIGYQFLFSKPDCVVGVSQDTSAKVSARHPQIRSKLVTIPNGIDTKPFSKRFDKREIRRKLRLPVEGRIVGTIGRLTTQKDHSSLLEAFTQIRIGVPDTHLIIIGAGELLDSLQKQRSLLELDGSVHFLGSRDNIPELLQAMDVFVLSSLWEGLPLVLLEAMAAGAPVVATTVGGVPEVIADGEEGLLVPSGDPRSLGLAMTKLLTDSVLARRLAEKAFRKIHSQYSVETMVQKHAALYERIHCEQERNQPQRTKLPSEQGRRPKRRKALN